MSPGDAACIEYCTKRESRASGHDPFSHGSPGTLQRRGGPRGSGDQLDYLKDVIDEGADLLDIAKLSFSSFLRHHRGLALYQALSLQNESREMDRLFIIYGPPGTGKTRWATNNARLDPLYSQVR